MPLAILIEKVEEAAQMGEAESDLALALQARVNNAAQWEVHANAFDAAVEGPEHLRPSLQDLKARFPSDFAGFFWWGEFDFGRFPCNRNVTLPTCICCASCNASVRGYRESSACRPSVKCPWGRGV
jgi:hypothetical protein